MAGKRLHDSEVSCPSKRSKIVKRTPPSYEHLSATLNERAKQSHAANYKDIEAFRAFVINAQREASANSVACGQTFSRACLDCDTAEPPRRAVCSNRDCARIVCSPCADFSEVCYHCDEFTEYIHLFEEESRECLICLEQPFSRAALGCGHIICTACALQMAGDKPIADLVCPYCRTASDSHVLNMREDFVNPPVSNH